MKLYIKILSVSTLCSILTLLVYSSVRKNDKIDYQTKFKIICSDWVDLVNKLEDKYKPLCDLLIKV